MSDVVNYKVPKQGIVSILGGEYSQEKPTTKAAAASSLRRTLSADMSSKRWLAQNEFCLSSPMKKIASSQQIAGGSSSCSSEQDEEDDSLEQELEMKEMEKHPRQLDVWSSILSQKAQEDPSKLPPPYVHPLVKKSASSLSEKSLEVCTESLGSETGSDVFSSYPSSETGDDEKEKEEEHQEEITEIKDSEDVQVVKNTHLKNHKKTQQGRSFPPPLASLARTDGPSVHMHSRRVDGRLLVEAVSVPSQKLFQSQRQNGRLVLTLIEDPSEEQHVDDHHHEQAEVFEISDEEQEEEEEEEELDDEKKMMMMMMIKDKEMGILKDLQPASNFTSGIINGQSTRMMMMKNIMERDNNKNPSSYRSHKLIINKQVKLEVVEEEEPPVSQSLLPVAGLLPKPPSTTTFNSYQYFWRVKPTVASVIDPVLINQNNPPTKTKTKSYEQKDLVLLRGNKADCLLPSLKCCKEPRRSVLMWEPYCIATS